MINKFKYNTRVKVLSILSAVFLWMFVMIAVNPQSEVTVEGVPVTITNLSELKDSGFIVYPKNELTADVYVKGELSKIRNITKDKIYISGEIKNPMEGRNSMYLRVNASDGLSCSLKDTAIVVELDKVVTENKSIKVNILGEKKDDVSEIKLDQNKVKVTGPRSMVSKVETVKAELKVDDSKDKFTRSLKLTPVDSSGDEVDDVDLSTAYVKADIEMFKQKSVPIKLNLNENTGGDIKDYIVSNKEIVIKGKKEFLDKVSVIDTEAIDLANIDGTNTLYVKLIAPEGVNLEVESISISKKGNNTVSKTFEYSSEEIEIRNAQESDNKTSTIVNQSVKVDVEYDSSLGEINKSDINLYIDLNQEDTTNSKYIIKYDSKIDFKSINIDPNIVEVQ